MPWTWPFARRSCTFAGCGGDSGHADRLGAQTCAAESNGAFTGESPRDAQERRLPYVILGHSERSTSSAESDELITARSSRRWRRAGADLLRASCWPSARPTQTLDVVSPR